MSKFTAKWQYTVGGINYERVIDTDQVSVAYDNRTPDQPGASELLGIYTIPPRGIVVLGNPDSGAESMALTFGRVFIVNGAGQTVGRYNLADVPPYLAQDEQSAAPSDIQGGYVRGGTIQADGSVIFDGKVASG